jgi:hypothetical protein
MWKVVLKSVGHQIFCPYVLLVATAFLTFSLVGAFHGTSRTASYILTGTPYFPIQICVGAISGFLVGRHTVWPITRWVWVLPAGFLLTSMIVVPTPQGSSLFGHWFGWSGASGHMFPPLQPGITMPFYLSATYSLFSLLGRRGFTRRDRKAADRPESAPGARPSAVVGTR